MADLYDRARLSVIRLLSPRTAGGYGAPLALSSVTHGAYDPATGSASETVTVYSGSGLRESYDAKDIDGTMIRSGDARLIVSPVQLSGADMPTITTSDRVTFDNTVYKVVQVSPWNYAGLTVGFELQVRP